MLAGLLVPGLAHAQDDVWLQAQSALCSVAIVSSEQRPGTPPGLLGAIAKAESGRPIPSMVGLQPWPWAIDADGQAFYFDSKAAAVAWARRALERGVRPMDVGCMQVNLQAHPEAFASLDDAFDPAANTEYAARFLNRLRDDAGGNWFTAVGFYHSRTPELAAAYRDRVAAVAAGRDPPVNVIQPLYLRALRQGTLRLSLVSGGVLRINLNRQPAGRGHRRASPCRVAQVLGPYLSAPPRAQGCGAH